MKKVWVGETEYQGRAIIISTGAKARMLGLDSEQRLLGHGVSTCATCDGFFFRGQEIAVVGGGDSAVEEATFLTRFADKVTLVHRRKELRASKIMQDRAFANPKIEFRWNSVVERRDRRRPRRGDASCATSRPARPKPSPVSGVFVAIGHDPNTQLFVDQLDLDENGYIMTYTGTQTSIPGVFAGGDVSDHIVPPGDHRGRHRLHVGARRRALPRSARRLAATLTFERTSSG